MARKGNLFQSNFMAIFFLVIKVARTINIGGVFNTSRREIGVEKEEEILTHMSQHFAQIQCEITCYLIQLLMVHIFAKVFILRCIPNAYAPFSHHLC
jgi:hypothetical protein